MGLTVADLKVALAGLADDAPLVLGLESEDARDEDLAEMVALELVDLGHGLGGLLLQIRVHLAYDDGGEVVDPEPRTQPSLTPALAASRSPAGKTTVHVSTGAAYRGSTKPGPGRD